MFFNERSAYNAFFVPNPGEPIVDVKKLRRVAFKSDMYNEAWLQGLIERNPTLLPTSEFGPMYSPLLCIGTEVQVGSGDNTGYIDNLYVTPYGGIVIVETKLFRNIESRRTVTAQIIDYAKELQSWDSERLDRVASDYFYRTSGQSKRMIDAMTSAGYLTYRDEAAFVDSINRNLADASFLLLIVGDGIRSNLSQLAEFINRASALPFVLALSEVVLYEMDGGIIAIPSVLARTTVISRGSPYPEAGDEPESNPGKRSYSPKPVLSRREFVTEFCTRSGYEIDQVEDLLMASENIDQVQISIKPTELHIDILFGERRRLTCLYIAIPDGDDADIYIRPDRMISALQAENLNPHIVDNFLRFFKEYIDLGRCKAPPYDIGGDRFYYASIDRVLEDSSQFVMAIEDLVQGIEAASPD